ncbi:MAG: undecaprenyldiphospho-muramoylpentapeptide beta-N-acetylglucosaminyltransferase [Gammaproteobacteria bacterium]|nr:undecaprenyldiphospho-muramoylpentapeptide beta-N-acetylglucosaminyltransferase [Gammaproteobacteria bacterium]
MIQGKKVLIMAGGTGGHIFPALAVAEALIAQGIDVAWLGRAEGMEADIVAKAELPLLSIQVGGLRGKGLKRLFTAPWQLLRAWRQASRHLGQWRPNLVLGFGGYASGPGGMAAFLKRTPLCIQEQNAIPGYTNRILAKMAQKIFTAFPEVFNTSKTIVTGNPLRQSLLKLAPPKKRLANRTGPIRILVLGGSQGAKALNDIIPFALKPALNQGSIAVRHQSGNSHYATVLAEYRDIPNVEVMPFIDDMASAYDWADLVIARAGAATISELAAVGLASILIPYPQAVDDHQTKNAAYLEHAGAAQVIPQKNLTVAYLENSLALKFLQRDVLLTMAEAAYALGRKDATQMIVTACLGVLGAK